MLGAALGTLPKDPVETFGGIADLEICVREGFPGIVRDSGRDRLVDLGQSHILELGAQQPARRNCSTGEDAGYPRLDGKTPWSFTVV